MLKKPKKTLAKKKQNEKDLQKEILLRLNSYHFLLNAWLTDVNGIPLGNGKFKKNPMKGFPDIIAVWNGQAIFIEVKCGYNKLTKSQEAFKYIAELSRAIYIVARSWEDVESRLEEIKKEMLL